MISHEYQCIFIHIPKCAGTSVEHALGHFDEYVGRSRQDHRSIRMIERPFLSPAAFRSRDNMCELYRRFRHQYVRTPNNPRNRLTVTKAQYDSYFKFTIVRNPWARAYSWYSNAIRDEVHRKNLGITEDTELTDFLREFMGRGALRPQLHWIRAFDGSIPLDYIGHFESLADDMREISHRLDLDELALPHDLRGAGDDYRNHYDDEAIDIVATSYREEIAMLGYTFDA